MPLIGLGPLVGAFSGHYKILRSPVDSSAGQVYVTPVVRLADHSFPGYFSAVVMAVLALHRATIFPCFLSFIAFSARISDPAVPDITLHNTYSL